MADPFSFRALLVSAEVEPNGQHLLVLRVPSDVSDLVRAHYGDALDFTAAKVPMPPPLPQPEKGR